MRIELLLALVPAFARGCCTIVVASPPVSQKQLSDEMVYSLAEAMNYDTGGDHAPEDEEVETRLRRKVAGLIWCDGHEEWFLDLGPGSPVSPRSRRQDGIG